MKLDVSALRYLSRDEFRVLTAVEMGMKNHELVPAELIDRIARLKHGGAYKNLKTLLRHKLVHHDSSKYDGYRLTYMGYDFLAINTLVRRGVIVSVGRRIGVGKESDIFEVRTEDGTILAMKLHRLGRTSFRAVKAKRDYLRHRNSYNWLYLSRLAALKEFAFMKALQDHGFPVPSAVDCNRHCVLMSLVPGYPLVQVKELEHPTAVFRTIVDLIVRLAEHGLIHCDFNEFNIMIDDDEKVTMIDFPQMVSVSHRNAQMYFDRDVDCIYKFFEKRFSRIQEAPELLEDSDADSDSDDNLKPCFEAIAKKAGSLDKALAASGFTGQNQDELEKFVYTERETTDAAALDSDYSDESEAEADDSMRSEELTNGLETLSEEDDNLQEASGTENHTADFVEVGFSPKTSQCIIEQPLMEGKNIQPDTSMEGKDDEDSSASEDDPVLSKRMEKQRKRAIASAHGSKKHFASRNVSKDRGGKKSGSAKMQMKSAFW